MMKTKIPWVKNPDGSQGYVLNPIKGECPMRHYYGNTGYACHDDRNAEPGWVQSVVDRACGILDKSEPAGIFVSSAFEWLWKREWADNIINLCTHYSQHRFYLLTVLPHRLWTYSPYPANCYVGAAVIEDYEMAQSMDYLNEIEAKYKFISIKHIEALCCTADFVEEADWVIIGSNPNRVRHPPREWVEDVIWYCDRAKVPVFIEPPLGAHLGLDRQEFPE